MLFSSTKMENILQPCTAHAFPYILIQRLLILYLGPWPFNPHFMRTNYPVNSGRSTWFPPQGSHHVSVTTDHRPMEGRPATGINSIHLRLPGSQQAFQRADPALGRGPKRHWKRGQVLFSLIFGGGFWGETKGTNYGTNYVEQLLCVKLANFQNLWSLLGQRTHQFLGLRRCEVQGHHAVDVLPFRRGVAFQ